MCLQHKKHNAATATATAVFPLLNAVAPNAGSSADVRDSHTSQVEPKLQRYITLKIKYRQNLCVDGFVITIGSNILHFVSACHDSGHYRFARTVDLSPIWLIDDT